MGDAVNFTQTDDGCDSNRQTTKTGQQSLSTILVKCGSNQCISCLLSYLAQSGCLLALTEACWPEISVQDAV